MTTSENQNPILTTTTSEEPTPVTPAKPKKPRKPRQPKPKTPKVPEVVEPKKETPNFLTKYGTYLVFAAVITVVVGVKNFHKFGDWTTPTPTPAPVEPSDDSIKAKKMAIEYFHSLAKDFDETRLEIVAGKHEDVSSWANALLKRTTVSKDTFSSSLNGMLGPVAGQTTITPETPKLLEEISNGWKSFK